MIIEVWNKAVISSYEKCPESQLKIQIYFGKQIMSKQFLSRELIEQTQFEQFSLFLNGNFNDEIKNQIFFLHRVYCARNEIKIGYHFIEI